MKVGQRVDEVVVEADGRTEQNNLGVELTDRCDTGFSRSREGFGTWVKVDDSPNPSSPATTDESRVDTGPRGREKRMGNKRSTSLKRGARMLSLISASQALGGKEMRKMRRSFIDPPICTHIHHTHYTYLHRSHTHMQEFLGWEDGSYQTGERVINALGGISLRTLPFG